MTELHPIAKDALAGAELSTVRLAFEAVAPHELSFATMSLLVVAAARPQVRTELIAIAGSRTTELRRRLERRRYDREDRDRAKGRRMARFLDAPIARPPNAEAKGGVRLATVLRRQGVLMPERVALSRRPRVGRASSRASG